MEMGWSRTSIISGFTIGIIASGLLAPSLGRQISLGNGRKILAASSILFALGLSTVGIARQIEVYVLGWIFIGAGMGCGLYDACFSTLGRIYGTHARRMISVVALIGGLASTVFWPLSDYLITKIGWRDTCVSFAILHLLICLPIYYLSIPSPSGLTPKQLKRIKTGSVGTESEKKVFLLFGSIMVLESGLAAATAVHLITILATAKAPQATTVVLGTLIGLSQISIRFADSLCGHFIKPVHALMFSSISILIAFSLISGSWNLWLAMVFYGVGIGLFSVVRATFPLFAFGATDSPRLIGLISRPARFVQALAPLGAAFLADRLGPLILIWSLLGVAAIKVILSHLLINATKHLESNQMSNSK